MSDRSSNAVPTPGTSLSRSTASARPLLVAGRQVDLRDVAGHHDPGVLAHPGQEHLHLRDGRILTLVEDDHRVVRASAPACRPAGRSRSGRCPCSGGSGRSPSGRAARRASGRRYGLILASRSPGRNPRCSPASTAGRTRTIFLIRPRRKSETAIATARYVLPVPAGPMQKTSSFSRRAFMYRACPSERGRTARLPSRISSSPD